MYAHSRHPPGLPTSQKAKGWQAQPFLLRVTPAQSARHLTGEQAMRATVLKRQKSTQDGHLRPFPPICSLLPMGH